MFYEQLKKACEKKGITVTKAITTLKISKSNVTNWKEGTKPNGEIIVRLSDLLEVTTDYLLKGIESNEDKLSKDDKRIIKEFLKLSDIHKGAIEERILTLKKQEEEEKTLDQEEEHIKMQETG